MYSICKKKTKTSVEELKERKTFKDIPCVQIGGFNLVKMPDLHRESRKRFT